MTAQITANQQAVIGIFETSQEANQAREKIQSAGINADQITIDDHVEPYIQVNALGTTTGAEAGLLLGILYGATAGIILVAAYSVLTTGEFVNSPFNRYLVAAFTVIGGLTGAVSGQRLRSAALPAQKQKGNPDIPRRFRLVVFGDDDLIRQARQSYLEQSA